MPDESEIPSFKFSIEGVSFKVASDDPSKFIFRFTIKCGLVVSNLEGSFETKPVFFDVPVDAAFFDSPQQIEAWFKKGHRAALEKLPGQLLAVTISMLDRSLVMAGNALGIISVDPKKVAEHHAREYEHSVKWTLGMSGRGRRPVWSKEELEQATRKAIASVRRKKKYSDPQLSDIADVFNKRFPDRGTFTANSVRQLLNRNGIRWRVLWKEIRNAQK